MSTAKAKTRSPRRRSAVGGYARGEETRHRIIRAAFEVFAAEGYAGASTRRIAAEAGVAQPALQYYFASKEDLHRACGQFIVSKVAERLAPSLKHARAALKGKPEDAVQAFRDLIGDLLDATVVSSEAGSWSRFMARCEAERAPAAEVVDAGIGDPLKRAAIALVAHAFGLPPQSAEARVRALLILSQLVTLWSSRDTILAALSRLTPPQAMTLLGAVLDDHVRRLLAPSSPLPAVSSSKKKRKASL